MKNDIKIIFVDIDWTIFDHSNQPSVFDFESIDALNRAQQLGVKVFISTARPYHSVEQIKLINHLKPDGMILSNGSLILYGDKVIYSGDIPTKEFERISKLALKHNLNVEGVRKFDCFLIKEVDEKVLSLIKTYPEEIPHVEDYHNQDVIGMCLFAPEEYDEIFKKDLPKDYVYFRFHEFGVDIALGTHDKGEAVKKALDYLNISKEHAIAIGDDLQDIAMFEKVKFGVAMGNGRPEVIESATHVAKHISEHGVKEILEELLFE